MSEIPAEAAWTVTSDGVAITSDLECGSGVDARAEAPGHLSVSPGEDDVPHEVQVKGPISCYNLCVLLENRAGRSRALRLDVRIPAWLREAGFAYFLQKPYLTCSVGGDPPRALLDWAELPAADQCDLGDRVALTVPLAPGERRVLSSLAHYPYSACSDRLRRLAADHPEAELIEIGESVQNRPILALEVGARQAPRAVFTGTLQPGEPSAWAVLPMVERALEGEACWTEEYRLCFVPQTNPDGIVQGRCNVNALNELAAFGFDAMVAGEPRPREVEVLWRYLAATPPVLYIDYHFLRLPDHPCPKPYFIAPEIYDDPARAHAAIELNERYLDISGAEEPFPVPVGHEMWRGLAAYQAAAVLDAVSFLYQYTGPRTSHTAAQARGPEVMRAALEVGRKLL